MVMFYLQLEWRGQRLWFWLDGVHVSLQVGGGSTACHSHAQWKLLQDPDYFLVGLANQRDAVDL